MNGFTWIALVLICWFVINVALKCIEIVAIHNAREKGMRKGLEHRALMMRMEKNGDWSASDEWC